MSKEFGTQISHNEIPRTLQDARFSYQAFRGDIFRLAGEIGAKHMGFGGEGKIKKNTKAVLANLFFEFHERFPKESLPEAVLLKKSHAGRRLNNSVTGEILDLAPSSDAEFFLPRSLERVSIPENAGNEFNPTNINFFGFDRLKKPQDGDPKIIITSINPQLSSEDSRGIDVGLGQLTEEEMMDLLKFYRQKFTSRIEQAMVGLLKVQMENAKIDEYRDIVIAIEKSYPIIRKRLGNLTVAVDGLKRLPDEFFVKDLNEGKGKNKKTSHKVFFETKSGTIWIVPMKEIKIFGKVFKKEDADEARYARSEEFVRYASDAGDRILDYLPIKNRAYVKQFEY